MYKETSYSKKKSLKNWRRDRKTIRKTIFQLSFHNPAFFSLTNRFVGKVFLILGTYIINNGLSITHFTSIVTVRLIEYVVEHKYSIYTKVRIVKSKYRQFIAANEKTLEIFGKSNSRKIFYGDVWQDIKLHVLYWILGKNYILLQLQKKESSQKFLGKIKKFYIPTEEYGGYRTNVQVKILCKKLGQRKNKYQIEQHAIVIIS